jgi:hypothetical protein
MTRIGRRTAAIASATVILVLSWSGSALAAPPANDNFANAITFPAAPGTVVGTNAEATRQTGEPSNGERTVWWKWTAPDSGRYRFDDCESVPTFDSVLGVYTGASVSALTEVARNSFDGGCAGGNGQEVVVFDAVAGTTYRFSVGGQSSSNMHLALRRTPLNDNYAAAYAFDPVPGTVVADNTEATRQTGEPSNGDRTLWWTWTAPDSGRYRLDDCESVPTFDSVLGVYTGASVSALTEVARNSFDGGCASGNGQEVVVFDAVAGTTYHFSVGGQVSSNVRLAFRRTPLNDSFGAAATFAPVPGTVVADNSEATRETGEPANGDRTLWWTWTAPDSGRYRLDDCESVPTFDSALAVYTGASVGALTEVTRNSFDGGCASGNGQELVVFDAVAGTTYRFSVGGQPSSNVRLALRRTPLNDNYATAAQFGSFGTVTATNVEATDEVGEPRTGGRSLWWTWKAPLTGSYRLDDCRSKPEFGSVLGVYTGASVAALKEVAVNEGDGGCPRNSMEVLVFKAVKGKTYHLVVGGDASTNVRLGLTSIRCFKATRALTKAQRRYNNAKKTRDAAAKALSRARSRSAKRAARARLARARNTYKDRAGELATAKTRQKSRC